jgi:hypothetical protein
MVIDRLIIAFELAVVLSGCFAHQSLAHRFLQTSECTNSCESVDVACRAVRDQVGAFLP